MSLGIDKPWRPASADELATVPVVTGVYEIGVVDGETLDIGFAGAREPFGLRSKIAQVVTDLDRDDLQFRYELHVVYRTRYAEIVLNHRAVHGKDPVLVDGSRVRGRLSPGAN